MAGWVLAGCSVAGVTSCRDPVVPEQYFPRGAIPLQPVPDVYATWWSETEACSGRKGNFRAVSFYVVPGAEGWRWGNSTIEGSWVELGNRITVGELRAMRARILRHEMLHAILRTGEHPEEYFVTRCGDIVAR
jgi:hypothetical protein